MPQAKDRQGGWHHLQRSLSRSSSLPVSNSIILRQNLLHHFPMHIRQPEISAGVAICELLVIEAEQVKDRRVEVVDVDLLLFGPEAEFVGGAVDVTALHAAAGHPH